ncbi:MAG: hypothetical protein IKP95_03455 [Ruminococcus sp.]|nr:hypothetical protein [Ruminococcus sp.]
MDKENAGKSMLDIEYVPRYQKDLGEALLFAKGKRSMAEFAKLCGMNPITCSRIVKGDIRKPLSQAEIRTIAEKSDEPTEDIFEYLMRANGMVPKDDNTPRRQESEKRSLENRQRRDNMQSIIMRRLFEGGKTISPVFNTPLEESDPILRKSRFFFSRNVNFALSIPGSDPEYWNFRINVFTGAEYANDPEKYKDEISFEVRNLFSWSSDLFLRDIWEPEAFENTRFSFVFVNKDLFNGLSQMLEGIKFNNSFSLILLDLDTQTVAEEKLLPRLDGKEETSLF